MDERPYLTAGSVRTFRIDAREAGLTDGPAS